MVHKWASGCKYRHTTAKDLDVYVVKVRYHDDKRVKLLVRWVFQSSGEFANLPGLRDGKDNIIITTDQFKYWSRI
jgi:hypothetical protein